MVKLLKKSLLALVMVYTLVSSQAMTVSDVPDNQEPWKSVVRFVGEHRTAFALTGILLSTALSVTAQYSLDQYQNWLRPEVRFSNMPSYDSCLEQAQYCNGTWFNLPPKHETPWDFLVDKLWYFYSHGGFRDACAVMSGYCRAEFGFHFNITTNDTLFILYE